MKIKTCMGIKEKNLIKIAEKNKNKNIKIGECIHSENCFGKENDNYDFFLFF